MLLQALFVNDVARRSIFLEDHIGRRPGRQCVTLLLLCNLAMTVFYVFEMQKVEANPVQVRAPAPLTYVRYCLYQQHHNSQYQESVSPGMG